MKKIWIVVSVLALVIIVILFPFSQSASGGFINPSHDNKEDKHVTEPKGNNDGSPTYTSSETAEEDDTEIIVTEEFEIELKENEAIGGF